MRLLWPHSTILAGPQLCDRAASAELPRHPRAHPGENGPSTGQCRVFAPRTSNAPQAALGLCFGTSPTAAFLSLSRVAIPARGACPSSTPQTQAHTGFRVFRSSSIPKGMPFRMHAVLCCLVWCMRVVASDLRLLFAGISDSSSLPAPSGSPPSPAARCLPPALPAAIARLRDDPRQPDAPYRHLLPPQGRHPGHPARRDRSGQGPLFVLLPIFLPCIAVCWRHLPWVEVLAIRFLRVSARLSGLYLVHSLVSHHCLHVHPLFHTQTAAIRHLAGLLGLPLYILNVHNGLTQDDIVAWMLAGPVRDAESASGRDVYVFLDEINTNRSAVWRGARQRNLRFLRGWANGRDGHTPPATIRRKVTKL